MRLRILLLPVAAAFVGIDAGSVSAAAPPILTAHNQLRAAAGLPTLRWSRRLAVLARKRVGHLIATGAFSHLANSDRLGAARFAIQLALSAANRAS